MCPEWWVGAGIDSNPLDCLWGNVGEGGNKVVIPVFDVGASSDTRG